MPEVLKKSQELCLKTQKVGVAVSWDQAGSSVDLDVQAVAFNSAGVLQDAVYYNNLKALKGMTHSGDEHTGEKKGYDECVWITPNKMPSDIMLVVIVVACYKGGCIQDAKNAKLHVLEDVLSHESGNYVLDKARYKATLAAALQRQPDGTWILRILDSADQQGQHFMDILEPTIGNYVRSVIPKAPKKIKAAFAMDKGGVVDLPQSNKIEGTCAGLGWDTDKGAVDLDVSAVLLDARHKEVTTCFFGQEEVPGVKHSGDNVTGEGSGDDEVIEIDLQRVEPEVRQIVFVINIYNKGKSFENVANPYCRLFSGEGELCRFHLKEAGSEQALVMARMFREPGDERWGFQALGIPCRGQTYKDSLPRITELAAVKPTDQSLVGPRESAASEWDDPPAPRKGCEEVCTVQ